MFYFYRLTGYTAMRHAMSTWIASLPMNFTSLCKTLHSQEKHCRYSKCWALHGLMLSFVSVYVDLSIVFVTYLATAWPTHPFRACEKGRQILTPENEAHICTIRVWITVVLVLSLITRSMTINTLFLRVQSTTTCIVSIVLFCFVLRFVLIFVLYQHTTWTDYPAVGELF